MTVAGPRITVLGGISVETVETGGARRVGLPGRRPELVLTYLALESHRMVSREELADALWPERLPDSWAAALRVVVSEVRRWLQDVGWDLDRGQGGYRLRLPPGASVDVFDAREALARARSATDPAAAVVDAARAAELARLPFLPHHDGDWVDGVRRELTHLRSNALDVLARARRDAGDPRAAAEAAEQLVAADPFNEAAHRLRIEVLAAGGDTAGARRAYEHCRQVLAEELGVSPSAETEAALRSAQAGREVDRLPDLAVLVVEDHDFQRRTALMLLRSLGITRIHEAVDGRQALEMLATGARPDVIVCDLEMPRMDGVEFIRHVAAHRLAGAVIIASGLDRAVLDAVTAMSEGYGLQVLAAVEKPLTKGGLAVPLHRFRRPEAGAADRVPVSVDDVRHALDRHEIHARFRPVLDLGSGRPSALEAVPVWRHAKHGPVRRAELTDLLEAAGCAHRLTDLLAGLAGRARAHLAAGGLDLSFLVALPESELRDMHLADRLAAATGAHGMPGGALTVMVDERVLRRGTAADLDVLTRLRIKGFGLGADHVGAEQAHLARAPLTVLRLAEDVLADEAVLESVLAAGAALQVIATGCDSPDDVETLISLGCRFAQGRLLGAAMPAGRVPGWAAGWTLPADTPVP